MNPLVSELSQSYGFRIDSSQAKTLNTANFSSMCSTQSDLLEHFILDEIHQRQNNFLVGQALVMAIFYLFILQLGLVTSILILVLESAILMIYILDFRNTEKVLPRDILGLLNPGREKMTSIALISTCTVICSWIHQSQLSSKSSANVNFLALNSLLGFGLAILLMVQKKFRTKESSKKLGPV
jgi:hypothetical protein